MTERRDTVRSYLERNGVNTDGFSARGIDSRAIEVAMGNITGRIHAAHRARNTSALEAIAFGLVALDLEGEA